ncbi:hypothetical protein LGQ02_11680 [Bacillus shivajii]|uniref:hypothetical protein n=1 Tax=Bacillus shivajii TaxID=1983719 RepID=UPI001CFA20F5|nr:hypothetical protein [Bacillus shivajii]UCZ51532.1 hypothetical protein LGQ02_11680 [Bacillus shivajii]
MESEIIIVFLGIGLFLLAGLFGGLGILFLLKNKRKQLSTIFLSTGVSLIAVYIITLFIIL